MVAGLGLRVFSADDGGVPGVAVDGNAEVLLGAFSPPPGLRSAAEGVAPEV